MPGFSGAFLTGFDPGLLRLMNFMAKWPGLPFRPGLPFWARVPGGREAGQGHGRHGYSHGDGDGHGRHGHGHGNGDSADGKDGDEDDDMVDNYAEDKDDDYDLELGELNVFFNLVFLITKFTEY